MAQIILNVKTNTTQATADLKKLETQVSNLSKSLSNVSTPKSGSELAKPLENTGKAAKTSAQNIETLRRSVANLLSQIKTLEKQFAGGLFTNTRNNVRDLLTAVNQLSKSFRNGTKSEQDYAQVTAELSKEYKKLAADTAQLRAENEKLATSDPFSPKQGDSIFRLQKQYASLVNSIKSAEQYYPKGTFDEIKTSAQGAVTGLQALGREYTTTGTLSEASQTKLNNFSKSLYQQRAAFETTKNSATNYHGTLRDLITGFAKFQISAMLVMKPIQALTAAWNSLNETLVETEKAVVSLQRVLDEDVASGEISSELYAIAQNLGQTFDNVQEIAQNFAKAGLSWQDTLKATEAAVLALNVAELTAEESSEGLIAVMQQFNYEASELTYVIDVLNKAADKSAVDTADLLVALQKTGSYASAANLSLEETVGLISALSEATAASGQNIGNALKSLFAYSSKSSSLEMFASLSDEMKAVVDMYQIGNASILDVWEKLAETMGNLSSEQATLLEQWSSESGLETELGSALGDVYDQLTGVYDTAGVYRKNYFIALLNNFDEVRNVMDEVADAQGYTNEEQAKYMDTYEAKLNSLQAQWEYLANEEQGWLQFRKDLLNLGSSVLKVVEWTGGLRTTILALGTALAATFGAKAIAGLKTFFTSLIAGLSSAATSAQKLNTALGAIGIALTVISAISGVIKKAKEEIEKAQQEQIEANNVAIQSANEALTANEKAAQQYAAYADEVKKFREVLADSTSTEHDKEEAQSALLEIQNALIESNKDYADSLDLINGSIKEQLELVEKLSDEQLKSQAQEWLTENEAAINIAQSTISAQGSTQTDTDWFKGYGANRTEDAKLLEQIFKDAGVKNAQAVIDYNNGFLAESFDRLGEDYNEGGLLGVIEGILPNISDTFSDIFSKEGWTGSASIGLGVSGTVEEQLEALEKIKDQIVTGDYGLTDEQIVSFTKDIQTLIDQLNSGEYQSAEELAEKAEIVEKYLNGEISRAEYLEKVYGVVSKAGADLEDQISRIEDLTDSTLDKLVSKLQEVRDAEKESEEIEERKKDLLEAQQELLEKQKALEDARNSRGLYRLNAETGQFEWVQDEKAIKDAEEEASDAQKEVDEIIAEIGGDARDEIIDELESGNATNESIKEILDKWYAVAVLQSGADTSWYEELVGVIKDNTGVDILAEPTDNDNVDGSNTSTELSNAVSAVISAVEAMPFIGDIMKQAPISEFTEQLKRLGISYTQSTGTIPSAPVTQTTIGNTTTTTNSNNSYVINGVKIGADSLEKPFGEVLRMVGLVPNA